MKTLTALIVILTLALTGCATKTMKTGAAPISAEEMARREAEVLPNEIKKANAGSADAQAWVGFQLYEYGEGEARKAEGMRYLKMGAENGSVAALGTLSAKFGRDAYNAAIKDKPWAEYAAEQKKYFDRAVGIYEAKNGQGFSDNDITGLRAAWIGMGITQVHAEKDKEAGFLSYCTALKVNPKDAKAKEVIYGNMRHTGRYAVSCPK